MTTTVGEFRRDIVQATSDDTSPEALVLPSGLMSSGKSTTVSDIIEYLEESGVDEEVSKHESDGFRRRMLEYGIVPQSWEKDKYPEDATLEEAVEWTSESEEGSEHDIEWDAEVEDVVARQEVYEMLGDWTLNSEGIALYDGSVDRNHAFIREAAQPDSEVTLAVQPVPGDAWKRYIEDWGGDTRKFLEQAREFSEVYGDALEEHSGAERVKDLNDIDWENYVSGENGNKPLNALMDDFSRIISQPERYVDSERFNRHIESMKRYSGRLEEFAENIQQQHETIKLAEDLDGIGVYYIDDITGEGENKYGHQARPADGSPEDLGKKVRDSAT